MRAARPSSSRAGVVGDVALGLLVLWVMGATWRFSGDHSMRMDGPPWGRPGHMRRPDLVPFTPVVLATQVAAGAAVALLRRWPVPMFLVGLVAVAVHLAQGALPLGGAVAGAVLAVRLVRALGLPSAWPWLPALLPAYAAHLLSGADYAAWNVVTMLLWTLLPLLAVALLVNRREAAARARTEELAGIAHAERLRVARDIHDVVGHSLSLISLQSGVALRVIDNDPDQARASLQAIRASAGQALDEVRRTLGVFRDDQAPLAPVPDLASLQGLVDRVRATGAHVDLDPLPSSASIPTTVQTVAHRVVQEALTNALRHAPGAPVRVRLTRQHDLLDVLVTDAGGHPGPIVEGGGLTGMRERVAAVGGRLSLTPGSRGFVVHAELPLPAETTARP